MNTTGMTPGARPVQKICSFFLRALTLALLGVAAPALFGQAYTWTTIAGSPGAIGTNDGIGRDARFNFPSEIAIDGNGVLFVSDLSNHTIRKVAPSGKDWVVTTIAGMPLVLGHSDGTNSDARFDRPQGLKVDSAGNIFLADLTHTIRKLTPVGNDWVVTTIAGTAYVRDSADGTNSDAHFYTPRGLAIEKGGKLAVVDSQNFTIRGITPVDTNWVVTTLAGEALYFGFEDGTNEWAAFNTPFGIASAGGDLFVADSGNYTIRRITRIGNDRVTTTIAGTPDVFGSTDGPASQALFYFPAGIIGDSSRNLFVTDYSNHTIRKLAAKDFEVSTLGGLPLQSGSADGLGGEARFKTPWGITVDPAGNLYVVDRGNHTIRKGTPPVPPPPELQIQMASGANSVILSWPVSATSFILERADDLTSAQPWNPVAEDIYVVGETYYVTNAVSGSAAFYRLHQQ